MKNKLIFGIKAVIFSVLIFFSLAETIHFQHARTNTQWAPAYVK